jgi:hypothetical protein
MILSFTSCQIGVTSSRIEKRNVAMPVLPWTQALTTVPNWFFTEPPKWPSRTAPPLFSRASRQPLMSSVRSYSPPSHQSMRGTEAPAYQTTSTVRSVSLAELAVCGAVAKCST